MRHATPPRSGTRIRSRTRPPRRSRGLLWGILALVGIGSVAWIALASDSISVAQVEVFGDAEQEVNAQVGTLMREAVLGMPLIRVDTTALAGRIAESFPGLRDIKVTRHWPTRVVVTYAQREPYGVWCRTVAEEMACATFDESAALWGTSIPSSGTLLLNITDERADAHLDAALLEHVIMLTERLGDMAIAVRRVVVPATSPDEVRLVSTEGFDIRFSLQADLQEQLAGLETFLADQRKKGDFKPMYLDVRVPGKIYYR